MQFKTNFLRSATLTLLLTLFSFGANAFSTSPPESDRGQSKQSTLTVKYDKSLDQVVLNSFNSEFAVQIFDVEGNTVKEVVVKKNKSKKISTKELEAGKYFVRYVGNSARNNSVKKLVIE